MAKAYSTTPAALLDDDIGRFSFNLEVYQADVEDEQRERERMKLEARRRQGGKRQGSLPDWQG